MVIHGRLHWQFKETRKIMQFNKDITKSKTFTQNTLKDFKEKYVEIVKFECKSVKLIGKNSAGHSSCPIKHMKCQDCA